MAEINNKKVGTFGNAGCFSFQTSKNMCMGEGGAVVSDDVEFIENNKEKIKNMIYSDIVLNAIDSVNEEDLDKNDKYYNSLIAIYKKSI